MEANKISITGGYAIFKNNNSEIASITSDIDGNIKISGGRIINVDPPINNRDVVTKGYLEPLIPLDLNLVKNHIKDTSIHNKLDDGIISDHTIWSSLKINTEIKQTISGNHIHDFDQIIDDSGNTLTDQLSSLEHIINSHLENNNPHNITKDTIGLNNVQNIKNFFSDRSPEKSDDETRGFSIGSRWFNCITEKEYLCLDPKINKARWILTTIKTTAELNEENNLFYTETRVSNNINVYANTNHRNMRNNPHNVTKEQVGLGNILNLKNNFYGTTKPNELDDSSQGYSIGSRWLDLSTNKEYVCTNADLNIAKWVGTTADVGDLTSTGFNIGDAGVGIYKERVDRLLKFKKLRGSTILTIIDNVFENTIDLDINASNINLNNLGNILSVAKGGTGKDILTENRFLVGNDLQPVKTTKLVPIGEVVGTSDKQTLTNKIIDCDDNNLLNIKDVNISDQAHINAEKIGLGTVSNTEFHYLRGVKSNIQHQLNSHMGCKSNPHKITKYDLGLGNVLNLKMKFSYYKPTNLQDNVSGFSVGSRWINVTTGKEYVCVDNSNENAVWVETTQPYGEVNFGMNVGSGETIYKEKSGANLKFKSIEGGKYSYVNSTDDNVIVNATNSHSFILAIVPVEAISVTYKTITIIPWLNSEFSCFTNGKIIFEAEIFNIGLDIKAYDVTHNADLGHHTTIVHSGHYSFTIANPGADARIEIQIKKGEIIDNNLHSNMQNQKTGQGIKINPRIYGIILTYTS